MSGKIYFTSTEQLADFLKAFTGSIAVFQVHPGTNGSWTLEFTGGY